MSYVSTLSYDAASSDTATVTGWTSVTDGQFALALVARGSVEAQPTSAPSGWTEIDSYTRAGNGPKYAGIFWKIKQSGDSNPTWEWAATGSTKVQIAVYDDDINESSPIADYSNDQYEVANTFLRAGTVTTAGDDTRVIFAGVLAGTPSATFTPTSGYTEDVDVTSSSLMSVTFASRTYPTIGATGTIQATMSTGGNDKHAFAVALAVSPTVLGTGSMTMSSGTPTASVSRPSGLGTGSMSMSGGNVDATHSVAADSTLGTGTMTMSGGGIGSEIGRVAQLGTGAMTMSGGSVRSFEYYTATLGTGTMVQSAVGINELFTWESDLDTGSMTMSAGQLITVDRSLLSYNQGRAYASAAELMRGCVWADNFVSSYKTKQIGGAIVGSPTYTNSVTLDGLSYITYNQQALTNTFSAVVRFSAGAASSGVLFGTQDPISASLQGWRIYVDTTGVRANHSDGSNLGVECTIDFDYADGVEHVATYVVDLVSGNHTLYLDDDSDTQSTAATGTIGAGKLLSIGGLGFVGTIQKARLFESAIAAEEHAVFYDDSLPALLGNSIGVYRCDAVSDQTDHIWTKTLNLNDLTKGDGVSAGYPAQTGGHYVFDGVDDYVSGWPTQPTLHTDSIAKTTSYPSGIPVIQQVNDDTIKTLLTTGGSYTGNLHSLVLSTGELTTLEKNHLEWSQLKKLWRQTHVNPFVAHLINQGIAVLVCHFDNYGDPYIIDYSNTSATILPSLVTWLDGLLFTNTNSVLTVDDDTDLRSDSVTIHLNGDYDFTGSGTDTLFEKGVNYYLSATYTGGNVTFSFNGQAFSAVDGRNIYSVAVSCVDGAEPRLYVNGDFIETASGTVVVDDTDTDDLLVGNTSGGGEPLSGTTKDLAVFNSILTDAEIRLLHNYSVGIDTSPAYTFPSNLLIDGDMESSGVTDWIAASGGVLTKTTENRPNAFGVRTLCIECIATDSVGAAAQIVLTSGLDYRITGWARADGVNAAAWIGNVSASDIASITSGTSWTYFDETFTASGTYIYLSCFGNVATSDIVWFDDVVIGVV